MRQLAHLPPRPILADLPNYAARIDTGASGADLARQFASSPELPALIFEPVGELPRLICREAFHQLMSQGFNREVFARRPVALLVPHLAFETLRLSHSTGIPEAAYQVLSRPPETVYDPVLVEYPDGQCRVLDTHLLLVAQTYLLERAHGLEEQLRQASKMDAIGQLAGGIAHDFNNLLTVVIANLELMREQIPDESPVVPLIRDAGLGARRAADLTHQLLAFSRRQAWRHEVIDPVAGVHEVTGLLRRVIDPRVVIDVRVGPDPWHLTADPGQFNQVLMNLCVNARDAMPAGGRLTLRVDNLTLGAADIPAGSQGYPGEFVRITVGDTGHGIPPDVLPRIFEPFYTTKEVGKGTGLGLATVYGIVRQCRGWVECRSRVGHGARFVLYFPRAVGVDPPVVIPAELLATDHRPGTILVVDDEELVRNVARIVLEARGYHVLLAKDGLEAIDLYQREGNGVDLVLLDLTMPHLSGLDTLGRLRAIDPEVGVLICSGYSADVVPPGGGEGVLGFVRKPYPPNELVRSVQAAVARRACAPAGVSCGLM
ncbi:MAG: signal transduction histidine kinase [Gemmataceae bacterium]|nr:signal transduction histidine kinase [Gemmataceae bacterium]